jgi:hypothetical protein
MGGKYKPLAQKCNQMIVPWNQLVRMVIVDDATNNFYVNTLRTAVLIEYN